QRVCRQPAADRPLSFGHAPNASEHLRLESHQGSVLGPRRGSPPTHLCSSHCLHGGDTIAPVWWAKTGRRRFESPWVELVAKLELLANGLDVGGTKAGGHA